MQKIHKVPVITILKDAFFACLKNPILVLLCFVMWGAPYVARYFIVPLIKTLPTNANYSENIQKTINVSDEDFDYEKFQKAANAPSTNWQEGVRIIFSIIVLLMSTLVLTLYVLYLPAYDGKKYSFSTFSSGLHWFPRLFGANLVYGSSMGLTLFVIAGFPLTIMALQGLSVDQIVLIATEYSYRRIASVLLLHAIVFIGFSRWCLFPLFIVDHGSLENNSLNQSNAITHGNTLRTAIFAALVYYFPPFGMMALVALYRFLLKHNSELLEKN